MSKSKLEYIWLDGYKPTQSLRSKTKIVANFSGKLDDCEMWSFDGSSTQQAEGGSSDCLLKPVKCVPDPGRLGDGYLVMCEVLNADGTPHESNGRATIDDMTTIFGSVLNRNMFWSTRKPASRSDSPTMAIRRPRGNTTAASGRPTRSLAI